MKGILLRDYLISHYLISLWIIVCGIYIGRILYDFWIRYARMIKAGEQFPGPPMIPILGNSLQLTKDINRTFAIMHNLALSYPVYRLWMGTELWVLIRRPEDIEIVMKSSKTVQKAFFYKFLEPLMEGSIPLMHGPKTQAHRKILIPMINGECIKSYIETANTQISRYIDFLINKGDNREFDIYRESDICISDIIFEILFGVPGVGQDTGDLTISQAFETCFEVLYLRIMTPWLQPTFLFNLSQHGKNWSNAKTKIHNFIRTVINEKRKIYTALARGQSDIKKPKPSIMDQLVENVVKTNSMTDEEIIHEMAALFTGYHDAVIGTFSFSLLMLAMHHDVQEKVREEVKSAVGSNDDIDADCVGKLNYTQMVIKEVMRLFPTGPLMARKATDDLELEKYTLPKGCSVVMAAISTHTSKDYWDEPDKFIPERFSPENSADRHPFTFIPFSGGMRLCPGYKLGMVCLKVIIARFILKFQLTSSMKFENLILKQHISVRSVNGYPISVKKIDC